MLSVSQTGDKPRFRNRRSSDLVGKHRITPSGLAEAPVYHPDFYNFCPSPSLLLILPQYKHHRIMTKKTSVLIVGAGEFGAGTALSLLKTGNYTVTMIDRAPELPALDAASTDMNKVVRWDYSDKDYAKLAREAIDVWNEDYKGIYFQ